MFTPPTPKGHKDSLQNEEDLTTGCKVMKETI